MQADFPNSPAAPSEKRRKELPSRAANDRKKRVGTDNKHKGATRAARLDYFEGRKEMKKSILSIVMLSVLLGTMLLGCASWQGKRKCANCEKCCKAKTEETDKTRAIPDPMQLKE
jgi:hypothetical protein